MVHPASTGEARIAGTDSALACVGDDSGGSIENTLQLVGRLLWCTDQEAATVVDPAGDERLDESSGCVVERASDVAQLSKLKEAFGIDRGDVKVKVKGRVFHIALLTRNRNSALYNLGSGS